MVRMNANLQPFREQLSRSDWFRVLPDALQADLLAHAELVRLEAKQILFRRGDGPCGLYAVLKGALAVGAVDAAGKEALLTLAEPTTWFGEISLFDGLPRTHDAIAAGNTLLLRVPQVALHNLLDTTPRYWRDFALLMAQKLRFSFIHAEAMSLLPAAQRLACRLLMIAEGYGGISIAQSTIKLSQERLATLLSLSRQTTNQLLKDLEGRGVVQLQIGAIEILDLGKLRQATEGLATD